MRMNKTKDKAYWKFWKAQIFKGTISISDFKIARLQSKLKLQTAKNNLLLAENEELKRLNKNLQDDNE